MRQFWKYATMTVAALAVGCGGGGGGGSSSTPTPSGATLDARLYNGHYVSECAPVPDGSNYETGAPLYARLVFTVSLSSVSAVADLRGRFDFYDDNACTGTALVTKSSWSSCPSAAPATAQAPRPTPSSWAAFYA